MQSSVLPGIRVVRGPNWIWQNQDDGEGHVGTVCEVGRNGSNYSPDNTVVVNWDSGQRTNYRIGYQNQYDLIIVDNAQIGIRHSNIVCDGCLKGGIAGILFKCAQCRNYHLCAQCYGADLHDTEHAFIRYTTPTSEGILVTPRKGLQKIQMKGIFVGAKVTRGPDWEWGKQDGGEGKIGSVLEIRGWDNESCRSVANVQWLNASTNVYRLGHKGNVDLKYTVPTSGGYYYKDHMPVLGQPEEQQPVTAAPKSSFSVGDRVKTCLDVNALIKLQQGHGGWNPRMLEHLDKLGTVHRITDKGDIRVQYDNCPNRWTFHPAALVKHVPFRVGDLVTVINDEAKVQKLQKGHGEWIENMKYVLGKNCRVIKVYSDGDLRIRQLDDGFEWTFNASCVKLERSPQTTSESSKDNMMQPDHHRRLDRTRSPLSDLSGTTTREKLVREAAQGHFDFVKEYLDKNPDEVDATSGGKSCIQVAAHQGHADLVEYLVSKGANVNIVDKEGDSALHYAAFGNQPRTMRILLENGANVNFLNSCRCSALHICAHKKTPLCVRELLQHGVNVNIRDSYGDTALHDAIAKENTEVVELLCNAPTINFSIKNNRGFNVLHHACLKGNIIAAKRILQLSPGLVNIKKDDGFGAMHLAALNGHANIVEILLTEGQAEIDIRNNRQQTPFLLAVTQGHAATIEKLVSLGCDVEAKDEDGDNALHICVLKKSNLQKVGEPNDAPEIHAIYSDLGHLNRDRLMFSILCYLVRKGCKIEQNYKGGHIFQWITEKHLRQLILSYQQPSNSSLENEISIKAKKNLNLDQTKQNILDPCTAIREKNPTSSNKIKGEKTFQMSDDSSQNLKDILFEDNSNNDSIENTDKIKNKKCINNADKKIKKTLKNEGVEVQDDEGAACLQGTLCALENEPGKCIVCDEVLPLIKFEPCCHHIACVDCGIRMKKCLRCGSIIERRVNEHGHDLSTVDQIKTPSVDRLRYLENKIQEYEESHYCSICMERIRDVVFLCGHGACSRCAETLRTCHMCRKTILKKINLY